MWASVTSSGCAEKISQSAKYVYVSRFARSAIQLVGSTCVDVHAYSCQLAYRQVVSCHFRLTIDERASW